MYVHDFFEQTMELTFVSIEFNLKSFVSVESTSNPFHFKMFVVTTASDTTAKFQIQIIHN